MEGVEQDFPSVRMLSEKAILIEFKKEIKEENLDRLLFYKGKIKEYYFKEKVEVINSYNSLLVNYRFAIEDVYSEISSVRKLLRPCDVRKKVKRKLFHIPVCYDPEFAVDMDRLSNELGLSRKEIIELHTRSLYTVYFVGFLPGFLYLGGLDKKLFHPRRKQPRLKIPAGSVGIGGSQTGIYPRSSPGGWQIIGNSPVKLFDVDVFPPCAISCGDRLRFFEVSENEHQRILDEVRMGNFCFKSESYHG